jgi:glycosyltransferase involved in cell wall biosynthesis
MTQHIISITSQLPWPLNSGGHLRTYHLQQALAREFHCTLVAPTLESQRESIEALRRENLNIVPVFMANRNRVGETFRFLKAWGTRKPYAMFRRHYHVSVVRRLEQLLHEKRPAALWLDHLDSFQFATSAIRRSIPIVVDLHNVYSLIASRMSEEHRNAAIRKVLQREAKLLRMQEKKVCKLADGIAVVSDEEADYYRGLGAKRIAIAPNGAEVSRFAGLPTGRESGPIVILFLGTLDWGPNVQAAIALADRIFPAILAKRPDSRLLLVGKHPSPEVMKIGHRTGVTVTGTVESTLPYLEQATIMAVPIESGGGTRLKILEAMASGLPVVSSTVGAEGIGAVDGESIVISAVDDMAHAILDLASNELRMKSIATNARQLVQEKYDWKQSGEKCVALLKSIVPASDDRLNG